LEQTISEADELEGLAIASTEASIATPFSQPQSPALVATSYTSTGPTTLDHPAMVTLIQNLPARYKVSKSPNPIHGRYNDILYAVDADTQQPIVIKSFGRRETWERECRTLRRLRGPCVAELKHVATLVLSETDDPNKPAKIRLTILERLDETLAQMLKNARKAKKVALREQTRPEDQSLDLTGPGLYKSGPALDEGYIRDIVKGVLRCLMWCHSRRIVYCDLKPSNVMHNRDDPRQQWKLIDLESSRVASEECIGIGTVRYCPPEVARGTTIDKQASSGVIANYSIDLWAFGCLVYVRFRVEEGEEGGSFFFIFTVSIVCIILLYSCSNFYAFFLNFTANRSCFLQEHCSLFRYQMTRCSTF
jgi:serine/threonine protein kinase